MNISYLELEKFPVGLTTKLMNLESTQQKMGDHNTQELGNCNFKTHFELFLIIAEGIIDFDEERNERINFKGSKSSLSRISLYMLFLYLLSVRS